CSWRMRDAAMFENIAWRWLLSRLKRRPNFLCRMSVPLGCLTGRFYGLTSLGSRNRGPVFTIHVARRNPHAVSVLVLEALGQLLDVVGRPIGHFHAEVQAHG